MGRCRGHSGRRAGRERNRGAGTQMARPGHRARLSRSWHSSECPPGQRQSGGGTAGALSCPRCHGQGARTAAPADRARRLGPLEACGRIRQPSPAIYGRPRHAAGVVEPSRSPSIGRLPASIRAVLVTELAALNRERLRLARREVSAAARRLTRVGWTVEKVVRRGLPLSELLKIASTNRADIIVVGARGAGGLTRALLGGVAEGTLAHAPVPVLIVK